MSGQHRRPTRLIERLPRRVQTIIASATLTLLFTFTPRTIAR
jgi:hypothetical protein